MVDSIEKFGADLILSKDLDPVYVALKKTELPHRNLCRWLIAYWCFYHAGVASLLSERKNFSECLITAAENIDREWPRNPERRHFRGPRCVSAAKIIAKEDPEDIINMLSGSTDLGETLVSFTRLPMFGPWVAFKGADMLEVLGLSAISFPADNLLFYAEPAKGLQILAKQRGTTPENQLEHCLRFFTNFDAPTGERVCGVQEVETILCKWKSHQSGNSRAYKIGQDTSGLVRDLSGWGDTAEAMFSCALSLAREYSTG